LPYSLDTDLACIPPSIHTALVSVPRGELPIFKPNIPLPSTDLKLRI